MIPTKEGGGWGSEGKEGFGGMKKRSEKGWLQTLGNLETKKIKDQPTREAPLL